MGLVRIWSLHPRHLDRAGLVACWRETLLAQAVLAGRTKGYTQHPQLHRFRESSDPLGAVGAYLVGLRAEATVRGYKFDPTRILQPDADTESGTITVTTGQLAYEWQHLGAKLALRSPSDVTRWTADVPSTHPLFREVPGGLEAWERP